MSSTEQGLRLRRNVKDKSIILIDYEITHECKFAYVLSELMFSPNWCNFFLLREVLLMVFLIFSIFFHYIYELEMEM